MIQGYTCGEGHEGHCRGAVLGAMGCESWRSQAFRDFSQFRKSDMFDHLHGGKQSAIRAGDRRVASRQM